MSDLSECEKWSMIERLYKFAQSFNFCNDIEKKALYNIMVKAYEKMDK